MRGGKSMTERGFMRSTKTGSEDADKECHTVPGYQVAASVLYPDIISLDARAGDFEKCGSGPDQPKDRLVRTRNPATVSPPTAAATTTTASSTTGAADVPRYDR